MFKGFVKQLTKIYDKDYKKLLLIPIVLYLILFGIIGYHYIRTGEFFNRDVSLTGGTSITITTQEHIDLLELEQELSEELDTDVSARVLTQGGRQTGIMVDATLGEERSDELLRAIESRIGELDKEDYSVQVMGSALGGSFFKEAFLVILVSFVFMALTVLIYFRAWVPSFFVILSVLGDIIGPFAILVAMDVKLSTAGIAAFLMLIGYSVDTDILLTTRVLRGKEESIFKRTLGALKTGVTISLTLFAAALVGFFFSQSDVIKQIMLILFVGALFDILNTWITNAAILRWYMEAKHKT
jgi:preprotein translocase subunit SecF